MTVVIRPNLDFTPPAANSDDDASAGIDATGAFPSVKHPSRICPECLYSTLSAAAFNAHIHDCCPELYL